VKKILFLTGTRADFGKLKPLIQVVSHAPGFEYLIAATGMHLDDRYGRTEGEISKSGFTHLVSFPNSGPDYAMDLTLARTVTGLSPILKSFKPDLLVVHGDRVEALAGSITGTLNNSLVAHIEGGEFSGTVDELMRHAITKLSHVHFVANNAAYKVLLQLGESPDSIFTIGSPEVDLMLGTSLPDLRSVKEYYGIPFGNYALLAFHPVTTEQQSLQQQIDALMEAVEQSGDNFVAVYPNNDHGSNIILNTLLQHRNNPRLRVIPSIRFEAFQTLLKNALYIVGNSSSGVREAGVHGTPAINVGTRQSGRNSTAQILNTSGTTENILLAMADAKMRPRTPQLIFGDGQSAKRFLDCLLSENVWRTPLQKVFHRS
jgi:UDP-N-acetylglucosamine 2-epimerase (hydrolysing)